LFFYEGGLAAGVEKRISPVRFAPVEMTAVFVGLSAWLKEVVEARLRAKARAKQILRLRRRMTTKKQKLDAKAKTKAKAKTR
jgi:predicted DNA-binding transcriptional regulator YafY